MTQTVPDHIRFQRDVESVIGALSGQARLLTRSQADAEDLVQDTLMHAYAGYRTFEAGTNFKAWLYRIMKNRWITAYRRSERRPCEVFDGLVSESAVVNRADRGQMSSAEDRVLQNMPDTAVMDALATLSQQHRLVLYYAHVEDRSYREVADLLGIPVGTVMSRLHRARRQMRRQLVVHHRDPCLGGHRGR